MRNLSVVTVLTRLGSGGPPIQAVTVRREMARRGHRSVLVTGRCSSQDGDMAYLLEPDDRIYWIPQMSRAVSILDDLVAAVRLWRFLMAERPDVVHTHTAKAGALGRVTARLAGVPVVVHTFHGNVLSRYFSAPVTLAIRAAEWFLGRLSDAVCVLSPQQARELSEEMRVIPRRKILVVPFGLDLTPYREIPPAPWTGTLVVGWLGRFVPVKDLPLLAAVVREAGAAGMPVRFLIAGDGPERPLVEGLVRDLGESRCRYLGWREDVRPVLAESHLLLQTSRNEGTPVALIQGMAAGRPFVSTPAGGVVDMVTGAETAGAEGCRWFANGALVAPTARAFCGAFARILQEPALLGSLGAEAARFASSTYTLEALVSSLEGLYGQLLERKSPRSRTRLAVGPAGQVTADSGDVACTR